MKRYLFNLALALDQFGNALSGGLVDETISSRLGRWRLRRTKAKQWPPPWYHPAYWLERGLNLIDPDHVLDAIEWDESEEAVRWRMSVPR